MSKKMRYTADKTLKRNNTPERKKAKWYYLHNQS